MKDYQKALNTLYNNVVANNKNYEAFFSKKNKLLQELVDKAIPTELKSAYYEDGNVESGYCPNCGLEQDDGNKDAHCRDCGQTLDWCIDD